MKGGAPVVSSNAKIPNDQMSALLVYGFYINISGGIQLVVPTNDNLA